MKKFLLTIGIIFDDTDSIQARQIPIDQAKKKVTRKENQRINQSQPLNSHFSGPSLIFSYA